jgi:hypothetical protein
VIAITNEHEGYSIKGAGTGACKTNATSPAQGSCAAVCTSHVRVSAQKISGS